MRKQKRRRLEAKGWKLGTTRTFLRLTPEEAAYIEIKLRLDLIPRRNPDIQSPLPGARFDHRVIGIRIGDPDLTGFLDDLQGRTVEDPRELVEEEKFSDGVHFLVRNGSEWFGMVRNGSDRC